MIFDISVILKRRLIGDSYWSWRSCWSNNWMYGWKLRSWWILPYSLGYSLWFFWRNIFWYTVAVRFLPYKAIFECTKARKNFENQENKKFILKQFRKASIRKVYDSLHGISSEGIPLTNAVEIMAYCLFDGKVDQESVFETNLYNELLEQMKRKAGFTLK